MIINDLDGYYIVFDTKNWNTELDTLFILSLLFIYTQYFLLFFGCKVRKKNREYDKKNPYFTV